MKEKSFRLVKRVFVFFLMICLFGLSFDGPTKVVAIEQDAKDAALNKGAAWIVSQQFASGGWAESRDPGTTSLALSALVAHAKNKGLDPLSIDYEYSQNVKDALNYIFSKTNRDVDNQLVHWGTSQIYVLGPALMAITAVETPDAIVDVEGSAVDGLTHKQVVQEIVNYIARAQIKDGNGIGMWYYNEGNTTGDMSISGWVTLGLMYAKEHFNIDIPQSLLLLLDIGIDYAIWDDDETHPLYGGVGYTSSNTVENSYRSWINIHKVGHLVAMMKLVGDPITENRVQASLGFIQRHFNKPNSGANGTSFESPRLVNNEIDVGWRGGPNGNDPYPSYNGALTIMKGLLAYGLDTIDVAGETIDWQAELDQVIVENQHELGYWQNGGYPYQTSNQYRVYYTAWAMMTLSRAVPSIAVTGVSLNCEDNTVEVGKPITLEATVSPKDATNPAVTWSSSNPDVASISDGVVTPLTSGTTVITVTSEDGGFTSTCSLNVVVKATDVSLQCLTEPVIAGDDPVNLFATFTPEETTNQKLEWVSSNSEIATIEDGVLTPLKAGETTITITSEDGGFTASCTVVIKDPSEFIHTEIVDEDDLSIQAPNLVHGAFFTFEELKQDAIIRLVVKLLEDENIPSNDQKLIIEYAKANIDAKEHAYEYFDVSLYKIVNEKETKLTSSLEPINIRFVLPKQLRDKNVNLYRVHNNKVETINYEYNMSTFEITFSSDAFSTYALVFGDDDLIVDTSDDGHLGGWFLLGGLLLLLISHKSKKENHNH